MKRTLFLLGVAIVVLLLLVPLPPGSFLIGGIHMAKYEFFLVFCLVMFIAAAAIHAQGFFGPDSFSPPPLGGPGFGPHALPPGGPGFDPPPPPLGSPGFDPLPPPIEGIQGWFGFTGQVRTVTVEQAKTYEHRTPVIVTGTIVQAIGGDLYTFRDSSGEIMLRIGPREWYALGSTISPSEQIEISGELHRDQEGNRGLPVRRPAGSVEVQRDWQGTPEIHARYIRKK